ncbi:hypothetical protein AAG570_012050 [Ranatra chinensis]|uniref:CUB domain-containing protein n=1 Tax=Ranatra chinensis TaxID=642074 RepID=A0ABD0YI25_9HEMI
MGKFPYSIIGTSEDLFVEFVSSPAGPLLNTGFHFNVGNWPGHVETAGSRNSTCDWLLTSDDLATNGDTEGIFLSVAHWYPPHTSCTYLIQGAQDQIVRLYFPSFRINRIESPIAVFDGDCGESLTLYDASWPDDSRIIKTFCDTFSRPMEKHDFVSTGSALFVRFESKTGSYSGSSLYYWAHYDFFNNTHFGTAVAGTVCDEEFSSWRSVSGTFRSPMNTLVYKRTEQSGHLACRYSFVTDRRLYARVIVTIQSVNFKDHPFNTGSCDECWDGRLDKLIVWEPGLANNSKTPSSPSTGGQCLCRNNLIQTSRNTPIATIVSTTETLNVELIVDAAHAASSYFKHPAPLFEARYEFVHSPLCGPAVIMPRTEGELHFPHYEALGYAEPPRSIRCIWEIQVNKDRDVWLHFDKIRFTTRDCQDGRLEVYLPSRPEHPFLSICGHNVSSKDMPPLTSLDLTPGDGHGYSPAPSVKIQFVGTAAPARAAFKIAWTELFHLPRNPDGTLMTSRLTEGGVTSSPQTDCEFLCPGESGLCIPSRLVCNGVVNCPVVNSRLNESLETGDEALELCAARLETDSISWVTVGLGACGGALLALACIVLVCRCCCSCCCCNKHHDDDDY